MVDENGNWVSRFGFATEEEEDAYFNEPIPEEGGCGCSCEVCLSPCEYSNANPYK